MSGSIQAIVPFFYSAPKPFEFATEVKEHLCLRFSCVIDANNVDITVEEDGSTICCTIFKHKMLNCSSLAVSKRRTIEITDMTPIRNKKRYFTDNEILVDMMFCVLKDTLAKEGKLPSGIDPFYDMRETIQTMFMFSTEQPNVRKTNNYYVLNISKCVCFIYILLMYTILLSKGYICSYNILVYARLRCLEARNKSSCK